MKAKVLNRLTVLVLAFLAAGIISVVQAANSTCASITSHLQIGGQGIVLPGDPNNIRSRPARTGDLLGKIPAGATFSVLDGPRCADEVTWWYVEYRGLEGWTAEGYRKEAYAKSYASLKVTPSPTLTNRGTRVPPRTLTTTPRPGKISPAMAEIAIETLFDGDAADVEAFICPSLIEEFGNQERLFIHTNARCKETSGGMECVITEGGMFPGSGSLSVTFFYENGKLCLD